VIEVIILALALSMDAFAVSIGLGAKHTNKVTSLGLMAGFYFGFFQGVMPFVGYMGGISVFGWIERYAAYLAFFLLFLVGSKLIYESSSQAIEDDIPKITHRVMFVLAIATSIDALAAGFSLTILDVNPFIACVIIGVTTFIFSWIGICVGTKSGSLLESKAELFGGIVIVLIGVKLIFV
jgi:putative Mn2+ efflux pump MntP